MIRNSDGKCKREMWTYEFLVRGRRPGLPMRLPGEFRLHLIKKCDRLLEFTFKEKDVGIESLEHKKRRKPS